MITGQIDVCVDDALPVVRTVCRSARAPQVRVDLVSVGSRPEASVAFHGTFTELREWVAEFGRVVAEAELEHYGRPSEYVSDRDAYGVTA